MEYTVLSIVLIAAAVLSPPVYCWRQHPRWPFVLGLCLGCAGGAVAGLLIMSALLVVYARVDSYSVSAAGLGLLYGAMLIGLGAGGYLGSWAGIIIAGRWCVGYGRRVPEGVPERMPPHAWRAVGRGAALAAVLVALGVVLSLVHDRLVVLVAAVVAGLVVAFARERKRR